MNNGVDRILLTENTIRQRVIQLAGEVISQYEGKPLTVVVLTNGAFIFAADLVRQIPFDVQLDTLRATSYHNGESSGKMHIEGNLKLPVEGRHVLLVDDIIDTGFTLAEISKYLENHGALSVKSCVLLVKDCERKVEWKPDFQGFSVPNEIIIGYGLDYKEQYRNLPYIAVCKPELVTVSV